MRGTPKSPTPIDHQIGAQIRLRRMLVGMSQMELGQQAGVTFQQIQKYEKGANRVSVSRLHQIAHTLGVPVEFFYESLPEHGAPAAGASPPADMVTLLTTSEAVDLLKAFSKIRSRPIRRRLVEFAGELAKAGSQTSAASRPRPQRR